MKYFFLSFFLCIITKGIGQNWVDLVNVYWQASPSNTIDGVTDDKRNFNMFVGNVKLPIVLNDKNILVLGLENQQTRITSVKDQITGANTYQFSSTMLQIGLEHRWDKKNKTLLMAIPRLNSGQQEFNKNQLQLGGLVLSTSSRNDDFDWKYGLYYNNEFFGHMFVPLFGFNWKINQQLRLKLIVPLNFEFAYMPNDRLRVGVRFDGINASYRYQNASEINGLSNQYIDKADNNVWAFGECHLGKNIWVHFKAGHSVLRKYRFFNDGDQMSVKLGPVNFGDDRNLGHPKDVMVWFNNGFSFESRLIYRLPF